MSDDDAGADVWTLAYRDLACVVSRSPIKECEASRENLMRHQRVNERVMERHAVLPMRFCTIAESADQIVEGFLKRRYDELQAQLTYFEDRHEYGVRAMWTHMDDVYVELLDVTPYLKRWRNHLAQQAPERARNEMILIGLEVEKALNRRREVLGSALFDRLEPHAAQSRRNRVAGDSMVLNAAFLIDNDAQPRFDAGLHELSDEYRKHLRFRCIGPTPPASFVELSVQVGQ